MNSQEVVDFINERLEKDIDLKTICEEVHFIFLGIFLSFNYLFLT